MTDYAELHCHSHFSFLDGASAPDELVERAVELGLSGLAVTDHQGLYGVVRFATAAQDAGLRPVIGMEVELLDAAVPDPAGVVVPRRRGRGGRRRDDAMRVAGDVRDAWQLPGERRRDGDELLPADGAPSRPRPSRALLPGYRDAVKEDLRGIGESQRGPHLVLLARNAAGYRSLCRLVSRANLAGTKAMPRFTQAMLAEHTDGVVALSGCREGEIARRLRVGDREGARAVAERYARLFASRRARRDSVATASFFLELQHHLLPDDDWLVAETALLAEEMGLPVVVTNDVHYAHPEGRELQDVLTAIRHGRSLDELRDLRRPDGESFLKSGDELMALPPGGLLAARGRGEACGEGSEGSERPVEDRMSGVRRPLDGSNPSVSGDRDAFVDAGANARTAAAWAEGVRNAGELAAGCSVDLGFERYRFPGFPVPKGHTPFSYLEELCHDGARHRYHPMTSAVVTQLAHELDVIERTGLAEFFLICWDIMRFARSRGIPAQGRGSAADSIVAYVLGITRVDPIRHHLLFERFINEGRTSYPDVDIDFSSERREEVIQYVYERYGTDHTGMVCNLVTYRARSAVREVGYALGFPRPLVDRVAKALETYDSVMVRRDLEAEGGFGAFFAQPARVGVVDAVAVGSGGGGGAGGAGELRGGDRPDPEEERVRAAAEKAHRHGLTDRMGQLNHPRGGRIATGGAGEHGDGRLVRRDDVGRVETAAGRGGRRRPSEVRNIAVGNGMSRSGGGERQIDGAAALRLVPPSVSGPLEGGAEAGLARRGGSERTNDRGPRYSGETGRASGGTAAAGEASQQFLHGTNGGGDKDDRRRDSALARGGSGPIERRSERDRPGRDGEAAADPTYHQRGWWDGETGGAGSHGYGADRVEIRDLGGGSAVEQRRHLARRRMVGSDTEGGPGDSPASIAWLAAEREGAGRAATPPARQLEAARDRAARDGAARDGHAREADPPRLERPEPHSSVARVEPLPEMPADLRRGSTTGMSDWDRWLAFCARVDGFPRHLSIHTGGMLVTAAPLVDIAPLERATMPGRVVVQFDKRDVETIKLIKLDLLGLGMLAAIDETIQLINADCGTCLILDRLPEDIPEVFTMLRAADTVGVFQVESRAQMQTLPKSKPSNLDDLVVEVAIIRPGPIQGNAVHPYLRRRQGLEPVAYLHPSLEPILRETLGVILYQEQVMQIAISVAGFSAAESDGFRRAMGTWRSSREMEKLHQRFVDGCRRTNGLADEQAEELFRQVAAFASFGFAKSHAAAFARTAYESAFLKLFYPAQFTVGLINAQPMGFYPVEVLINDAKRHGVAVLPVDVNASAYRTTTEWVGPGRQRVVRSSGCVVPREEARRRWAAESSVGYAIRLGLGLVKGIGEEHQERLDAELARGPYRSLADVVDRTGLPEEVIERLIRSGALDSLGQPRRQLLWQLREVMGATRGRAAGREGRGSARFGRAAGRPIDLRLPPTPAPPLPPITERERLGDAYAVLAMDPQRQVVSLFRPALDRLGAVPNASLYDRGPGPVRLGGLVVTRQHPMTARGTVFLALEDETGMVNVTLWPDTWARLRGIVRRHALLYVEGMLQREGSVVNVVAREVKPLPEVTETVGGPRRPEGVRSLGYAGMRRA